MKSLSGGFVVSVSVSVVVVSLVVEAVLLSELTLEKSPFRLFVLKYAADPPMIKTSAAAIRNFLFINLGRKLN